MSGTLTPDVAPAESFDALGASPASALANVALGQHPELIWFNGALVPWASATVHVMTHALHYGSSVFEGMRCYETPRGPALFRAPADDGVSAVVLSAAKDLLVLCTEQVRRCV